MSAQNICTEVMKYMPKEKKQMNYDSFKSAEHLAFKLFNFDYFKSDAWFFI